MSLNAALNLFLEVYKTAIHHPVIGNAVAEFVRREFSRAVAGLIGQNDRYIIHGSPDYGNRTYIPWVAVYDRHMTKPTQDDLYVVYLVQEDYAGIYLSLNQNAPVIRRIYGPKAKRVLVGRAWDHIDHLGQIDEPSIVGLIDLKVTNTSSLGTFYELGSICARYYKRGEIPDDDILDKDLKEFLALHLQLSMRDLSAA